MAEESQDFVEWFRGASPYINAHRGRTFVIQFGGEAVESAGFHHLIQDIALLNGLGVRIVLVHGIRPQIETRLRARHIEARFKDGLRITDDPSLVVAREAAGYVRVSVEALLSMGLPNSPMAGARLRVTSGNFVTARPVGIRDGVDFCHTGEVRRVDRKGIERQLEDGAVVLVSNMGYSPTGEAFNLSAEDVATAIAVELKATKLLLMGEQPDLHHTDGKPVRQLTLAEARRKLAENRMTSGHQDNDPTRHLQSAIYACTNGVKRAHLMDRNTDGVLLLELFTRDGVGTMVSAEPYENVRQAGIEDVGGILELIEPLEQDGILVRRPREKLEQEIHRFTVVERDGTTIACAALYPTSENNVAELACLAVHPAYRNRGFGDLLLERLERDALALGAGTLCALTTRAAHWFLERGFEERAIEKLPVDKQLSYNYQRNSKVLLKRLRA